MVVFLGTNTILGIEKVEKNHLSLYEWSFCRLMMYWSQSWREDLNLSWMKGLLMQLGSILMDL
jgi:hypothetical protein